jgi:hypothetical protein
MICNKHPEGWEIVYQRAHALLAAQLVAPWREDERGARWTETLAAVAQHDDGWQEWEPGGRLSDIGTPLHFREAPMEAILSQSEQLTARAWHQSLWVGLLVSRHLSALHEPLRGHHADLDSFLDRQTEQRAAWRRRIGVKKSDVTHAYAFLALADTLSLLLCERRMPYGGRSVEIGDGPGGARYNARLAERAEDGGDDPEATNVLTLDPWPYRTDAFTIHLDTYRLPQLTFASHDALIEALRESDVTVRSWRVQKDA